MFVFLNFEDIYIRKIENITNILNIVKMKKTTKASEKENEIIIKQKQVLSNPINQKMRTFQMDQVKFGKSIRARLTQKNQVPNRRASQPLQETSLMFNRQSIILNSDKPVLEDISKMSVSFISRHNENKDSKNMVMSCSRTSLSKTKSVRFSEFEQTESASLSKSTRKNQSILKNSNSSDRLSSNSVTSHVGSISGGLSIKASLKDKGIDCENKKYQNTLKILVHQSKKFFDDMFPPGGASLFHSKGLSSAKNDIRWVRIQQIYKGQKLILYNHSDRNIVKKGEFPQLDYMATCFNALGTSQRCLERIFQNQQYSRYGIYYLRLNHEGIWKYTIVDDFIPVRQVGKNYESVFMNVCASKSNYVQIWPLLLQKALAKMYSTYQCLFNDTTENLMQQLTGIVGQKMALNPQLAESNQLKIKSHLMNKDNILIGCDPSRDMLPGMPPFCCLSQSKKTPMTYFSQQSQLTVMSISQVSSPFIFLQNLHLYFNCILLYSIDDSFYSVGCVIKQQKGTFSLRTFKIDGYGRCALSLIQKDRKYYRNNGYDYCWMRLILVCKDIDGYRYIGGTYGKGKVVSGTYVLSPGQYFVLINGDWGKKVYDVTLNYQGNVQTQIKRQPFSKFSNIIDEACRDMAQRFGTFVQLNKNICSYQYCDKNLGLIIQNFNNQLQRQVYFHRIYRLNFKNFVNIGSAKFVQQDYHNAQNVKKTKDYELQTFLEAGANLTVVVMLQQGVDQEQFNQFKFSSF